MDKDLVLIFGFVLTIIVIVTLSVSKVVSRSLEHKERMKLGQGNAKRVSAEDYRKLEERVRVLERIATDSNHALASQIEQLRDLQELDVIDHKQEAAR